VPLRTALAASWRQLRASLKLGNVRREELLGQGDPLVVFNQERALDLVARHGQVALRMGSYGLVLPERQLDPGKAAPLAAFAEEGDRNRQPSSRPFSAIRSFALRKASSVCTADSLPLWEAPAHAESS
jgi:hypothetical protein